MLGLREILVKKLDQRALRSPAPARFLLDAGALRYAADWTIPPSFLARYIARSARCSKASIDWPSSGKLAMPMLRLAQSERPSNSTGSERTAFRMRRETSSAPCTGVGQQGHELVPAIAGKDVALAQLRLDAARHLAQHAIARVVPVAVVDHLEVVHVDHEDAGVAITSLRLGEERSRDDREPAPVVHAGAAHRFPTSAAPSRIRTGCPWQRAS